MNFPVAKPPRAELLTHLPKNHGLVAHPAYLGQQSVTGWSALGPASQDGIVRRYRGSPTVYQLVRRGHAGAFWGKFA